MLCCLDDVLSYTNEVIDYWRFDQALFGLLNLPLYSLHNTSGAGVAVKDEQHWSPSCLELTCGSTVALVDSKRCSVDKEHLLW